MILSIEVTAPDAPRSLSMDTIRATILEHVSTEWEGLTFEIECETDDGRVRSVECEFSCVYHDRSEPDSETEV